MSHNQAFDFDPQAINVGIVAADFNKDIVNPMIEQAEAAVQEFGGTVAQVLRVPGCYEMMIIVDNLLKKSDVDAVVVLGYIEKGETLHGEIMGHVAQRSLIDLGLKYQKVISFGIIGPGATLDQAEKRNIPYARAAVRAAFINYGNLKAVTAA